MLVTLDEAKTYAGVTNAAMDEFIGMRIGVATAMVEHYCKRTFQSQDYTQKWIGIEAREHDWWEQVFVDAFPITATAEIRLNGNPLLPMQYQVFNKTGCYFFTNAVYQDQSFKEQSTLEIDFTGGLDPIPTDLKSVVLDYVKAAVNNNQNPGSFLPNHPEIKEFSIAGIMRIAKYEDDRSDEVVLNSKTKYLLDAYRSGNNFPDVKSELIVRGG